MATPNRFEIQIAANTEELRKGIQDAKNQLREYNRELRSRPKADTSVKDAFAAERLEGQKLINQTRAVRLESAQLTLEKRKNANAVNAAAGSYREAQQRLTALGRSIREAKGGFDSTNPVIQKNIAEYRNLNNQLKAFDAQMGNHQRNVGNYGSALSTLSPQLGLLAGSGAGLLATAVAARDAYNTISTFDSGLRNVEKTTGLTRVEIEQLGKEFIQLSRNLQTVSTNDLTQYATVAGQLGVKGTRDILAFTEALAKLETASNISGEEGGAEIARTLTLIDGGVQNVKAFGDEIVNLGNNFAATEKEILGNAESIAQNVGIYKIGRQDVLAFATATKSVGIEAELVGSTFNRTLAIFESAIRTGDGLKTILNLIGGSEAELAKRFKIDSAGVFVDFIGALNKVYKEGGSVNAQLESIGVNAVRDQRVIQSLAANGYDVLTRALETAKSASGALDAEFETASGKMEKQVGRIKIAWDNLVLSIESGTGAVGKFSVAGADAFATLLNGITDIITSRSWKEFFSRLGQLSSNSTFRVSSKAIGDAYRAQETNPNARPRTQFERAVSRSVSGFDTLSESDQYRKILVQTEIVQKRVEEYKARADKDNFERLKLQNSVLAEMNKLYYEQVGAKKAAESTTTTTPTTTGGGKTQAELIQEANEAISKGMVGALNGVDAQLLKIDNKYNDIFKKINKITDATLRGQLLATAEVNKQLEISKTKLDNWSETYKKYGFNMQGVTPSSPLSTPTTLPGLEAARERFSKPIQAQIYPEMSKYIQSTLRRGVSNTLMGVFEDIGKFTDSNYEIERKYAELRENASASQIAALRKMERLEKQISNGLTNTLTGLISSISSIGARTLSSAVGEGISSGDFSQLSGLFRGKNKAMGYGALSSTIGGLVSSLSPKTSTGGQALGGLLSGGGTGAMIGSLIPGIGTAIGAVVGGIVGAIGGIFGSSKAKKERELQELQLAEQRKQTALMERQNALAYASSIIGQMTNQGIVTGVDRNAYGELVASISGDQIQLVLDRSKKQRG